MKLFWSLALLAILAACQVTAEYSEEDLYVLGDPESVELNSSEIESVEEPVVEEQNFVLRRAKRATCDLLSGLGVNHSACAAHCLVKRFKGGYCNSNGICVCRN